MIKTKNNKILPSLGCLNCPQTEDILPLSTVLYNGFGGYSVLKDGKLFYQGDPAYDTKWESYKTLRQIERIAAKTKAKWEVELFNPLRGATWQRKGKSKWVLTKTNMGFA